MTINNLHKQLTKLIAEGYGRVPVAVAKETFRDNRESDGCTILDVHGLGVQRIHMADDDGGTAINRDGSERTRLTLILAGSSGANSKGEIVSLH